MTLDLSGSVFPRANRDNFGETFGAHYANFARLNFATPAPVLREIVTRMAAAVRRR